MAVTTPLISGASGASCRAVGGEGEPVVLVHGSSSDLRTWEQQLAAIGASYRTIAYSRRYARPNDDIEPDADDQMLPHVDDLITPLRHGTPRRPTSSATPGARSSAS